MKSTIILMASVLLLSTVGMAQTEKSAKAKPAKPAMKSSKLNSAQLGTSFRFDGSSLHGKFQSSPSTVATVENDKYLEDLLGARRNFKDRSKRDGQRN